MEAPPKSWTCILYGGDGISRCSDCFSQQVYYTSCMRREHLKLPFHTVEQWTGSHFKELSLILISGLFHQKYVFILIHVPDCFSTLPWT
ncbi:hypothetical protein HD554DRAFT_2017691 [Boletus coccyginus]|nr:hypothetical protein HD554DRAFT_2017691 [Boletus coccyginus]